MYQVTKALTGPGSEINMAARLCQHQVKTVFDYTVYLLIPVSLSHTDGVVLGRPVKMLFLSFSCANCRVIKSFSKSENKSHCALRVCD